MSEAKPSFYGGQAVLEGVMMRGRGTYAVAVRLPDETIQVRVEPIPKPVAASAVLRLPFVRGLAVLVESLRLGFRALIYSAQLAASSGPVQVELGGGAIGGTAVVAALAGIFLFVLLPVVVVGAVAPHLGWFTSNLAEGLVRAAVLIGYLLLIGRLPDIQRFFAYHAAEHKVINAFEAGVPLEVASVQQQSRLHPRCGTGFLVVVLVVSLVVFSLAGRPALPLRLLSRLVLVPVVVGCSYELVRLLATHPHSPLARLLLKPVLASQHLTTREPGDGPVEVAISAFTAVRAAESTAPERDWGLTPEVVA